MGLEEGGRGKESDGEQYPNTLHVCREMTRKCTGSCGIIGEKEREVIKGLLR
jgi:hypothetical protein